MIHVIVFFMLMIAAWGAPKAILSQDVGPEPPTKYLIGDVEVLGVDSISSPGGRFTIGPISDWVVVTFPGQDEFTLSALGDVNGKLDDAAIAISFSERFGVQCRHLAFSHNQARFEATGMLHEAFFEMVFDEENAERLFVNNVTPTEDFVLKRFERVGEIKGAVMVRHDYEWAFEVEAGTYQGFGEIELVDDIYRILICSGIENQTLSSLNIEQMRFQMRDSVHVGPRPVAEISDVSEAL